MSAQRRERQHAQTGDPPVGTFLAVAEFGQLAIVHSSSVTAKLNRRAAAVFDIWQEESFISTSLMFCVWFCQTHSAFAREVQVVRRPGRKTRFVCAVLVLVFALGALAAPNSPSHGVVLSVAAQTVPATSNTTVSNTLTLLSDRLSVGSVLYVDGVVTTPQGPLAFVPVTLHVGSATVARTQTNESGAYTFSVPVGLILPEAFSGSASVYTVAEPGNPAFPATSSAVASIPVSHVPAYLLVAVVTGAVVLGIYVNARPRLSGRVSVKSRLAAPLKRFSSWTSDAASERLSKSISRSAVRRDKKRTKASEPASRQEFSANGATVAAEQRIDASERATVSEHTVPFDIGHEMDLLTQAPDLLVQGDDRQAVSVLYNAALTSLAKTHELTLIPSMTHWERYAAVEGAVPEVGVPLRTLTTAYERIVYAGRPLTDEHRNAAIDACQSILEYLKNVSL